MSIYIRNCMHYNRVKKDIIIIRKLLEVEKFDIGIMFVNSKTMSILNKRYRGIDKPTDILSFSFYEVSYILNITITKYDITIKI